MNSMSASSTNGTGKVASRRLTKEDWCQSGLDLLAESRGVAPKVRQVASELGVTYGSFYHHFSSADDLYRQMLQYWRKTMLGEVTKEHLEKPDPSLSSLMETLVRRGLPRFDVAIRQWAESYEGAAAEVKKADSFRMRMAAKFLEKRGVDPDVAKARGEMLISMHIGNLAHPDPNRRAETFSQFVEMADKLD
jgi:AcrR family transcriptional regulator